MNSSPLQSTTITFIGFAGSCWGYAFGASVMFAECSLCRLGSAQRPHTFRKVMSRANLAILTPPHEVGFASATGLLVLFLEHCEHDRTTGLQFEIYAQIGSQRQSWDGSRGMMCIAL
jgi:hypothetical protein